jgi:hypothetical protein
MRRKRRRKGKERHKEEYKKVKQNRKLKNIKEKGNENMRKKRK